MTTLQGSLISVRRLAPQDDPPGQLGPVRHGADGAGVQAAAQQRRHQRRHQLRRRQRRPAAGLSGAPWPRLTASMPSPSLMELKHFRQSSCCVVFIKTCPLPANPSLKRLRVCGACGACCLALRRCIHGPRSVLLRLAGLLAVAVAVTVAVSCRGGGVSGDALGFSVSAAAGQLHRRGAPLHLLPVYQLSP